MKKNPLKIKGLSFEDIMDFEIEDLEELNRSELSKLTSRLVSVANKRIKSLQAHGVDINLKSYILGGKFSVKGKNKKQLLREFSRASEFLSRKTSTWKGYKEYMEKIEDLTSNLSEYDKENFWKIYKFLYHMGDIIQFHAPSDIIFDEINDYIKEGEKVSIKELNQRIVDRTADFYIGKVDYDKADTNVQDYTVEYESKFM